MSLQSQVATPAAVVLRDGAVLDVRALEPVDRDCFAAGVARLSRRSLYLRFASPKPRLTERDLDALLDLDHHEREALLAVDRRTGDGVAVARYGELRGEAGVVDVAVTVIDAWQGRGLGHALMQRLLERARREGHVAARASVLAENAASLRLVRALGFRPHGGDGALREFELVLV